MKVGAARLIQQRDQIISTVDTFMRIHELEMLAVSIRTRSLCKGPMHTILGAIPYLYDEAEKIQTLIANGQHLILEMQNAEIRASNAHKSGSNQCSRLPIVTVTAKIDGLESQSLQFLDQYRSGEQLNHL